MARNTAVRVLDDLTGGPAAQTVGFGLDGVEYEIDLTSANAAALRKILGRYADAARRVGGRKQRPRFVPGAKKPVAKQTAKPVAGKRVTKAEPASRKAAAAVKTTPRPTTATKTTRAKKVTGAKATPAKTAPKAAAKTTAKAASPKTAKVTAAKAKATVTKATAAKTTAKPRRAVAKVPAVKFSATE